MQLSFHPKRGKEFAPDSQYLNIGKANFIKKKNLHFKNSNQKKNKLPSLILIAVILINKMSSVMLESVYKNFKNSCFII